MFCDGESCNDRTLWDSVPERGQKLKDTLYVRIFRPGMVAGSISAAAVNPADVVKTRLQLLNKGTVMIPFLSL